MPAAKGELRLLSFDDLLEAIDEKLAGAVKTKPSWKRLREVTQEIGAADTPGFDPIGRAPWRLERLRVTGYRGIQSGDGLAIDFDPTPGITIMHGANGAGKSSIADALRTVLHGGPRETQAPSTGGKRPLWDPVHLAAGSSEARVEVTLSRGKARMLVRCTLSEATQPEWSASVTDGDSHVDVTLAGAWVSALASYHPVYAYADWEREVQTAGDLRSYLEGMLALGGCFAALDGEVAARGELASEARKQWETACNAAMRQIELVDERQRNEGDDVLPPVTPPTVDTDVDGWLEDHDLTDTADLDAEVTDTQRSKLEEAAQAVQTLYHAIATDTGPEASVFAPALAQLHTALAASDHDDELCPVCLNTDPAWPKTLASTVAKTASPAADREPLVSALMDLLNGAATTAEALGKLTPLCDDDVSPSIDDFVRMSAEFSETAHREDLAHSPTVRQRALAISEWILGEAFEPMMASCVQLTDRRRQWRRARARALAPFVGTLRHEATEAREAALWGDTRKRVGELQKHLQREREDALQRQLAPQISDLLGDVDMRVDDLAVQKTQAKLELSTNSTPIGLGMLSAGQRNAVLLAPLLAVADEGPFGFLILDDPVHAFDELRLDRLAKTLEPIARQRRVVVLTHDQRLAEHLRSRPVATTTHSVTRDAVTGEVAVRSRDQLWTVLLDDAQALVADAASFPDCQLTVTQAARGLCRQALDHAIRELVVSNAVANARDVSGDLERLEADKVFATKERLKIAKAIVAEAGGDTTAVEQASDICAPHVDGWNMASHGNPETTPATEAEIDAARDACVTLAAGAA